METTVYELDNGLQVIYKYIPYTKTVHCGYVINAGSRDDRDGEMGMAHFIEHMIFKGTEKRKNFHILNYLESVGGDVNAYTTKEKTCLYASMVSEYFERATEFLTDITFHSIFPQKEIAKEKQVISEEIDLYRNMPDEAIFEDFDELIYPNHGLGHPILGTKDSIRSFTQDKVRTHLQRAFIQGQVVYSIVGNVPKKKVEKVIHKYLAPLEVPSGQKRLISPNGINVFHKEQAITTDQAHVIFGTKAFPMRKSHYFPFLVLNNLLGGPSMNSKLSLNVREKYGLTYNISSFYTPYIDSGIWGIYYACEKGNMERIQKLVWKELEKLKSQPLGAIRLSQAKKQLVGQMTLGYENLLNQMLSMAKDLLDFRTVISFDSYIEDIQQVNSSQILEAANEIFQRDEISTIVYKAG
ncbi:MAG: pitrilysin family protein [Bacteroidota bacterium]